MRNETYFSGKEGFYWWFGVCEDRMDPDQLGKIKVRILGAHTKDKSFIASNDLKWATVISPITNASMNGIGETPIGILPGTWCLGFFLDGEGAQEPCILGSLGGIPQAIANSTIGFNDPRPDSNLSETFINAPRKILTRTYPTDGSGATIINGTQGPSYPQTDYIGEPDTNRIARNQNITNTLLQVVKNLIDNNVPIAFGGSWSEPVLYYNGKYPYVHVSESESGHIKVVDDTPNAEGQIDIDRSGTFEEILTNGSKVIKIVKDGYTIVMGTDYIHVMNDKNEYVQKDYNLLIGGKWNVEVKDGDINIKTDSGNLNFNISGDANINVNGDVNLNSKNTNINSTEQLNLTGELIQITGTEVIIKSGNNIMNLSNGINLSGNSVNISSETNTNIASLAPLVINSTVSIGLIAPTITSSTVIT
jgi:hypothetical protein